MSLLTLGGEHFVGAEQQSESIYAGQRLACLLAKTLIEFVTERKIVPETVYYRHIPLLLETLARTCGIWTEIEEALSPGNWTADGWFQAQPLVTPVATMQSLSLPQVQLGTQPAFTQSKASQNTTVVQNRAVVHHTTALQEAPFDPSKNKWYPAAQNPATESTPWNRTLPPPY